MSQITVVYDLDLGALGHRQVDVIGKLERNLIGNFSIEIFNVVLELEGSRIDLYPHIRERDLSAMKYGVRNAYLTGALRGNESAGEVVA